MQPYHRRHHHYAGVGIRELDLSACHPKVFNDRMRMVSGLRTSTAFFTFLRANLVLSSSAMSSCANTPLLEPTTERTSHFVPPSPSLSSSSSSSSSASVSSGTALSSPLAISTPIVAEDDIPDLVLEPLTSNDDKCEALHLVADSVAEMQPRATKAFLLHPICLVGLATAIVLGRTITGGFDLLFACGMIMSYLLAARYLTSGYVRLAESTDWAAWLRSSPDGTSQQDIVLGARYGETLIGAVVLRIQPNPTRKSKTRNLRGGRGVIRAWTTKLKYRGTGIGSDLLQEALRVTKDKCGRDAEIGFAKEHANSTMLLPKLFSNVFKKDEVKATKTLSKVVGEWGVAKKKKR